MQYVTRTGIEESKEAEADDDTGNNTSKSMV
jgi:hypothetical protein